MSRVPPRRRSRGKQCLYFLVVVAICLFVATTGFLSMEVEKIYLSTEGNVPNAIFDYWNNENTNRISTATKFTTSRKGQQPAEPFSASFSDSHAENNKNALPYFVVHIGPQKTMSSAIQCSLQKLEYNLTLDDYKFVGKCDARACYTNSPKLPVETDLIAPFYDQKCVKAITSAVNVNHVKCWTNFQRALAAKTTKNDTYTRTSIILSDEKLSEAQMQWWDLDITRKLWKVLQLELSAQFQFRVVMVYRRYYEWLASVKNQGDKYSLGRRGIKLWNGPAKEAIYPHLMRWMANTSEIPTPYLPEMYDLYQHQMQLPVSLLNMHDGTDLLDNFLCHVLKNADHTCEAYRDNPEFYQSNSNPSENHFYDMISYAAYHRGLVRDLRDWRKGADRLFYTEMIGRRMKRLHKTPLDLPLTCPSKSEVRPLLDRSLELEEAFLPDFFVSGKGTLEAKFWKDVDNQKFCSVNTTAVLEQRDWQVFLHNLWDPRRGTKPKDWETSDYKISLQNFTGGGK